MNATGPLCMDKEKKGNDDFEDDKSVIDEKASVEAEMDDDNRQMEETVETNLSTSQLWAEVGTMFANEFNAKYTVQLQKEMEKNVEKIALQNGDIIETDHDVENSAVSDSKSDSEKSVNEEEIVNEEVMELLCSVGHSWVAAPTLITAGWIGERLCDSCGAEKFVFIRCCSECNYELCEECYVTKLSPPGEPKLDKQGCEASIDVVNDKPRSSQYGST